jgi:hypothetical protein
MPTLAELRFSAATFTFGRRFGGGAATFGGGFIQGITGSTK